MHAARFGRERSSYEAAGANVAVVGSGGLGTSVMRAMQLGIPVLVDRDKHVYRTWGLDAALGMVQKTATFVVDATGVVRWARASYNPHGTVDRDAILSALRGLPPVAAS